MSLFSCHLVKEKKSGEINLSALKLIEIDKKRIKNVQLNISENRMIEMDSHFNDQIEPPKSKFSSQISKLVSTIEESKFSNTKADNSESGENSDYESE